MVRYETGGELLEKRRWLELPWAVALMFSLVFDQSPTSFLYTSLNLAINPGGQLHRGPRGGAWLAKEDTMMNPPTLYTFDDLRNVGYGQSSARHGLKLLLWLAKNCIKVDYSSGTMKAKFSRDSYGFRHYGNYQSMLPDLDSNEDYFEVGNRNNEKLPGYLRTDKHHLASNKDRVIIRMKKHTGVIKEVYITEHYDWSGDFNPKRTYHISGDLIRILQNHNAHQFTFQNQHGNRGADMGNRPTYDCFNQSRQQSMRIENVPNSDCENVMVCLAIMVIIIILLAIMAIFSKGLKQ